MKNSNPQPPSFREIPITKKQTGFAHRHGRLKPGVSLIVGAWCWMSFFAPETHAQPYSVDWYKISGGGGTSGNGQYSIAGTIGQQDASGAMTGGPMIGNGYSLTGGFWALYAVQTPGAPVLTITYAANQAVVSWPSTVTGWTLQTNNNLATPAWGNYLGNIVNNCVTSAPPNGNLFFRLKQ